MRVGLLGTGPWAEIAYGPALRDHSEVEFVGVWGRRPEAAASIASAFGGRPYASADSLIDDAEAIAIALPPSVQAPLAARAARAGRHLLLDKPLAIEVTDARAVVDAAAETGVASVVFFTSRFTDAPRKWIAEQSGRDWYTGRAEWLGALGSGDSPFADSPWRWEKGGLWDVGPHALSVLLPVLGDVEEVLAAAPGREDTVHLVLRHSRGASSTVTLSLMAPKEGAGNAVELRGVSGVTSMPSEEEDPVTSLSRAIDALLEAADTGRAHPCDARFGLRVVEILATAAQLLGR
ncbi:Gfo/Idh/MocA family oxidoreductase [Actinomadura sp. DC4]|uniref:Gfo/Idh/MocA family protein n=1 Tax=Actinomadura sp. DC4 TaxID=3055069 RepID=UPI0025B19DAB|nr:Gfo/Idh/MocA family oxidoreductase [Actinomadura sp. DC4]MDN3351276.1 Gfo/Idh/MocA family oxidoreductase [Actinomadura sp. DC4]